MANKWKIQFHFGWWIKHLTLNLNLNEDNKKSIKVKCSTVGKTCYQLVLWKHQGCCRPFRHQLLNKLHSAAAHFAFLFFSMVTQHRWHDNGPIDFHSVLALVYMTRSAAGAGPLFTACKTSQALCVNQQRTETKQYCGITRTTLSRLSISKGP